MLLPDFSFGGFCVIYSMYFFWLSRGIFCILMLLEHLFIFFIQCLGDFTYTGMDPLASSHAPVPQQGTYYPGEHLMHPPGYLHEPLQGSISPRRSPAPPPPLYQDFDTLEPHLPPPDDFLDPDRRGTSGGSRRGSHEKPDTPSTPLLRRNESCVWCQPLPEKEARV